MLIARLFLISLEQISTVSQVSEKRAKNIFLGCYVGDLCCSSSGNSVFLQVLQIVESPESKHVLTSW